MDRYPTKTCTKCFSELPLDCFYSKKRGHLGKGSICIPCNKAIRKASRSVEVESYYHRNKEKCKARNKEYRSNNRSMYNKLNADWAKKNPEKRKQIANKWAALNPQTKAYKAIQNRKTVDRISDSYVADLLRMKVSDIPKELIEAKRIQIQIQRYLKNGN